MTTIGLFRVDVAAKTLTEVPETDLAALGLKERYDLQEWIDKNPSILGEELLIIAKECSSFDATSERADLVALDSLGRLVVIELKRDDSGTNVHWQAVKYASYFSKAKPEVILELLAKREGISVEEAGARVLSFTAQDDLGNVNRDQRIVLVSHRFAREVTSAVLWLREHGVDISCVQLTPYSDHATNAVYMQATTIIPVPGTEGYTVSAASPGAERVVQSGRGKKDDDVTSFLRDLWEESCAALEDSVRPDKTSRWAGVSGEERYFNIWYRHAPWQGYAFQYKLTIAKGDDGAPELSVGLIVQDAAARKAGLGPEQIKALKEVIDKFDGADDAYVWPDPTGKWTWCGVTFPAPALDEVLRHKAAAALQALIEYFTPAIDDIAKPLNERGV